MNHGKRSRRIRVSFRIKTWKGRKKERERVAELKRYLFWIAMIELLKMEHCSHLFAPHRQDQAVSRHSLTAYIECNVGSIVTAVVVFRSQYTFHVESLHIQRQGSERRGQLYYKEWNDYFSMSVLIPCTGRGRRAMKFNAVVRPYRIFVSNF